MEIMDNVWARHLAKILDKGHTSRPRDMSCMEILHETIRVDMNYPVLTNAERKLSYKFMAAEAFWILSYDDRVDTIAPYNSKMGEYSDDGVKFFGAYGPKIGEQLPYIINKLREDPDTRQATINIWRENPPKSKDIPCTVSICFSWRDGKINAHVFMRSSDAWLGLPYDVFNFSMLAHMVCAYLNKRANSGPYVARPGTLYLTMVNAHIYHRDMDKVYATIDHHNSLGMSAATPTPEAMWLDDIVLYGALSGIRRDGVSSPHAWW